MPRTPPNGDTVVRVDVRRLSKDYGAQQGLHPTTFTLLPGTLTVLAGPNGAGKSTVMKRMTSIISGGGQTLYDGQRWTELPNPRQTVGLYLGSMPFHTGARVIDHLNLAARMTGTSASQVAALLDRLSLTSYRRQRISQLSMGMRQRLGIASALLPEPPVLILDEPFSALDPDEATDIYEWVRDLAQADGRTLLISTHHLDRIEPYATHALLMANGRLHAQGTPTGIAHAHGVAGAVNVACSAPATLQAALAPHATQTHVRSGDLLAVSGLPQRAITEHAAATGVRIFAMWQEAPSLSTIYSRVIS